MSRILFVWIFALPCLWLNAQTLNLPARNPAAYNGTQIVNLLTPLSLSAREDSIFEQVMTGNVPDFQRTLVQVSDTETVAASPVVIRYYVLPDYLALGCDSDYFLCPMTPLLAQRIADATATSLPTRKMVNQIWQQAPCKLAPQTIAPSPQMTTVPVFATHNGMVWTSRSAQIASHPLGTLTGGDKKDVIISNQIYGHPSPGRVVIYGWHQLSGSPIQPLYYGHEETYADYSHGIRLVQNDVWVDGSASTVQDVLASASLNVLLSDEGVIDTPRYPVPVPQVDVPVSFCVLDEAQGVIRIRVRPDPMVAGYQVMLSSDGLSFFPPQYFSGSDFTVTVSPDTLVYAKIAAAGTGGGQSLYSEVLAATTSGPGGMMPAWLMVNGFDRAVAGNTYHFIRQHASAAFNASTGSMQVSSATNEAVCDSLVLLTGFSAVDYILGEESSADETFSDEEQQIVAAFLDTQAPFFVSGSEIGWDLDHLGSGSDQAFYHNYLLASYVEDAPNNMASTYYQLTSPETGSDLYFDNGSHGTYNVRYPDVIAPYPTSGAYAAMHYTGFPAKYAQVYKPATLVYLAVPFETIYPESARQEYFDWVCTMLFYTDGIAEQVPNALSVFPNPAQGIVSIQHPMPWDQLTVCDLTGRSVDFRLLEKSSEKTTIEISVPGCYIISIHNATATTSARIVIVD